MLPSYFACVVEADDEEDGVCCRGVSWNALLCSMVHIRLFRVQILAGLRHIDKNNLISEGVCCRGGAGMHNPLVGGGGGGQVTDTSIKTIG